jgi:hypothetical protein
MLSPIRYRNHFRWRVMPPEGASEAGFFDHSFGNKKEALDTRPEDPAIKVVGFSFPSPRRLLVQHLSS